MTPFVTVFEVDPLAVLPQAMWRIPIGLLLLLIGVVWLHLGRRRAKEREAQAPRNIRALGLCAIGLLWTLVHIVIYVTAFVRANSLAAVYDSGRCRVAEGRVEVLYEQREQGHDDGDLIRVADEVFEVDYFGGSGGYRRTIAHGGALRERVYVRIHHHEGKILRLDVGKPPDEDE